MYMCIIREGLGELVDNILSKDLGTVSLKLGAPFLVQSIPVRSHSTFTVNKFVKSFVYCIDRYLDVQPLLLPIPIEIKKPTT